MADSFPGAGRAYFMKNPSSHSPTLRPPLGAFISLERWERMTVIGRRILFHRQYKSPDTHYDQYYAQQEEDHPPGTPAIAVGVRRTGRITKPAPVAGCPNQDQRAHNQQRNLPVFFYKRHHLFAIQLCCLLLGIVGISL